MVGRWRRNRRWSATHRPTLAVALGLVVLAGTSTWVWVTASKGSKEADLGSSLFSGLVVGIALLVVGKMFDRTAQRGQADTAMQQLPDSKPAPDSTRDVTVVPQTANTGVTSGATGDISVEGIADSSSEVTGAAAGHISLEGTAGGQAKRTFELAYESTQRDTSRLDAQQIRLRLFEIVPGQDQPLYTQFVTIPVPSPELRRFVGADPDVTEGRLWWHIAESIKPRLVDAIQRGDIPTPTPSFAYEVATYDLDEAVRRARRDPDHEVATNETIYTFSAPAPSTRDDELAMQIRQLVGYDSAVQPLVPDGPRRYKMDLERSLPPAEQRRLEELALYNGVQIEFQHDGEEWTAGSAGS